MRVLLLGATGSIGGAILPELLANRHAVLALARSDESQRALIASGAEVVRGDLHEPGAWSGAITSVDAVIHVAATFSDDMGEVDRGVVDALIASAMQAEHRVRFVYTGGAWLYGETGDEVATEDTPYNPIPSFAWAVDNGAAVLAAPCFDACIVHPGMTYVRDGGVLARLLPVDGRIEVWGSLDTRWPVVHREDLATAYRLVLESGRIGESYNANAERGVRIGDVAAVVARRFGLSSNPRVRTVGDVVAEQGDWAVGPTLDQQMSSRKIRDALGWAPTHTDVLGEMS